MEGSVGSEAGQAGAIGGWEDGDFTTRESILRAVGSQQANRCEQEAAYDEDEGYSFGFAVEGHVYCRISEWHCLVA